MNLLNQIVMESYMSNEETAAFESVLHEAEDFSAFDSAMEADTGKASLISKIAKAFKDTFTKVINFIKSIGNRIKKILAMRAGKSIQKKSGKALAKVSADNCPLKGIDADDSKFIFDTAKPSHDNSYVTTSDLLNATNALKKEFESQLAKLQSADPTKKDEFNQALSEVKKTNAQLKKLTTICANVDKLKDPVKDDGSTKTDGANPENSADVKNSEAQGVKAEYQKRESTLKEAIDTVAQVDKKYRECMAEFQKIAYTEEYKSRISKTDRFHYNDRMDSFRYRYGDAKKKYDSNVDAAQTIRKQDEDIESRYGTRHSNMLEQYDKAVTNASTQCALMSTLVGEMVVLLDSIKLSINQSQTMDSIKARHEAARKTIDETFKKMNERYHARPKTKSREPRDPHDLDERIKKIDEALDELLK